MVGSSDLSLYPLVLLCHTNNNATPKDNKSIALWSQALEEEDEDGNEMTLGIITTKDCRDGWMDCVKCLPMGQPTVYHRGVHIVVECVYYC